MLGQPDVAVVESHDAKALVDKLRRRIVNMPLNHVLPAAFTPPMFTDSSHQPAGARASTKRTGPTRPLT